MSFWKNLSLAIFLAATAVNGQAAGAAGPEPIGWKVGVAKTDITPAEPMRMAGFGFRTHPSEGVRDQLYTRALALQDESGKIAVISTLDLAGISREIAEVIADRCKNQYGLERDRLEINVSHTHSGPATRLTPEPARNPNPNAAQQEEAEAVRRYTGPMIDKVVTTIGAAIHNLKPATLEFGQGMAGIAVNRRRSPTFRGVPGGPVDSDVPVLAARDADGKLVAIVVGYACHATSLTDYMISNDFPGYALHELDDAHPGVISFFIQGCAGDSNAFPRLDEKLARIYGDVLAAAVEEVLRGKMIPLNGPLATTLEYVDLPYHNVPTREELQRQLQDDNAIVHRHAQHVLTILDRDGKLPSSYSNPVQVWQFGHGLKFIALGGEPVADIGLRLKRQYGFDSTWVAGYSNDVMAYIPSLRVLKEGGYEGGEAAFGSGQLAPWGATVEEIVIEKVNDVVLETERKIP